MHKKACTFCGEIKPATLQFFHKARKGLHNRCKSCRNTAKYGITVAEYDELLSLQNGRCAVCGVLPRDGDKLGRPLSIDHDHETGKIRGLLCMSCNIAIGNIKENVDSLKRAVRYLEDCYDNPPKRLYEILVPKSLDGEDIDLSVHWIWDGKVRDVSGGLTIHRSAKGEWISPKGELVKENMIPVRIACTEEQIHEIGRMTKEFYRQERVMYYRISDKVFIV